MMICFCVDWTGGKETMNEERPIASVEYCIYLINQQC